jgi:hypothetical protein
MSISGSDVEQLARKLNTLSGHFTADEWTLLCAVLDVAGEAVAPSGAKAAAPGAPGPSTPGHVLASFTAEETDTSATKPPESPDKIGGAS